MGKVTVRFFRELKTHLEEGEDIEDLLEDDDFFGTTFERRKKLKGRNDYDDE